MQGIPSATGGGACTLLVSQMRKLRSNRQLVKLTQLVINPLLGRRGTESPKGNQMWISHSPPLDSASHLPQQTCPWPEGSSSQLSPCPCPLDLTSFHGPLSGQTYLLFLIPKHGSHPRAFICAAPLAWRTVALDLCALFFISLCFGSNITP